MKSVLEEQLVEKNIALLVGDKLVYSDMANYMEYEVTEVFPTGFTVRNLGTDLVCTHELRNLQHGWQFARK